MKKILINLLVISIGWASPLLAKTIVDINTGGYVKLRGQAARHSDDSFYNLVDDGTYLDLSMDGRLKGEIYFSDIASFEAHYEMVLAGGDTRKNNNKLARLFSGLSVDEYVGNRIPEDDTRLFDLTAIISDEKDRILYHRMDRLSMTLTPEWGVLRLGRQVVTWGNGMLFNPMDLFNPFAPTDIEREYKIGDDMVSLQAPVFDSSDLQLLYVPRRDPKTGNISQNHSSIAAKYHFIWEMIEFDVMAASHYKDTVFGVGSVGYLGNAAWRTDFTWTRLDSESRATDFVSLVANMDYSWVWLEKNFYGFLEFYHSGIGENDYQKIIETPDLINRIQRGEIFTLGKTYLACNATIELHPLMNIHLTAIANIKDPSGFLQPMATYSITQNMQILMGASFPWGYRGSEFGGVEIPETDYTTRSPDTIFIWMSYYF